MLDVLHTWIFMVKKLQITFLPVFMLLFFFFRLAILLMQTLLIICGS